MSQKAVCDYCQLVISSKLEHAQVKAIKTIQGTLAIDVCVDCYNKYSISELVHAFLNTLKDEQNG